MGHAHEELEHAEHIAHAGHGGDSLSRRVGITMALLGVTLAFAAARVGAQRVELTQALVDQQHAHAKFTQADIKHRVAVLTLQQLHAEARPESTSAKDMMLIAGTIDRYLVEAQLADKWVDTYDPLIEAHAEGQEHYELAQLAAEIGIVIASIALLLKRREPWLLAIVFGVAAIGVLGHTYWHTHGIVHDVEHKTEESEKAWEDLHKASKTDAVDKALVEDVKKVYGPLVDKPAAPITPR
jgi:hypothetical protein